MHMDTRMSEEEGAFTQVKKNEVAAGLIEVVNLKIRKKTRAKENLWNG